VCNTRKNASRDSSKSDRIDARKLSEQLYMNNIKSVYHGEHGLPNVEGAGAQLSDHQQRSHPGHESAEKPCIASWGIPCAGKEVYAPRHRAEWLAKISEAGVRDAPNTTTSSWMSLRPLHQEATPRFVARSKKHKPWKLLRLIPGSARSGPPS